MVEVDVIGQLVDALPVDRLVLGQARAYRRQHVGVGPELGVAGHAGFGRRQSCETRFLHRGVAVAAIESETADMVLVAERYRLIAGHVLIRDVWRSDDLIRKPNR